MKHDAASFLDRFLLPASACFLILIIAPALAVAQSAPPAPGITVAQAIDRLQRQAQRLAEAEPFGYDLAIGPGATSPIGLVSITDFGGRASRGLLPYSLYADLSRHNSPRARLTDNQIMVKWAIPLIIGDSYKGHRVVGTSPQLFGVDDDGKPVETPFEQRKGKPYLLSDGRVFAPRKFEAVIGSAVADNEKLKAGDTLHITHGFPAAGRTPDIHRPTWTIVGVLRPTGTAADRDVFIPVVPFYAIAEHESGLIQQALMRGGIDLAKVPPDGVAKALESVGLEAKNLPPSLRRQYHIVIPPAEGEKAKKSSESPGLLRDDDAAAAKEEADAETEDPEPYHVDPNGNVIPDLPPGLWALSAIMVQTRNQFGKEMITYNLRVLNNYSVVDPSTAVNQSLEELRSVLAENP